MLGNTVAQSVVSAASSQQGGCWLYVPPVSAGFSEGSPAFTVQQHVCEVNWRPCDKLATSPGCHLTLILTLSYRIWTHTLFPNHYLNPYPELNTTLG